MTAVSAGPAQNMAQLVDDKMEMGSPYHGHDDFEIDLDAMEYQASNGDNDVMVGDAFNEEVSNNNEAARGDDADMEDDAAVDPPMVDAAAADVQHQLQQTGDMNGQYHHHQEESIEADMADEYEEYGDAAYLQPHHHDHNHNHQDEHDQEQHDTNVIVDDGKKQGTQDTDLQAHEHTSQQQEESVPPPPSSGAAESSGVDSAEVDQRKEQHEEEQVDHTNPAETVGEISHPEVPAEELHADDETEEDWPPEVAEFHGWSELDEQAVQDAEDGSSPFPVKVLYQENDISLFPPHEGDSSEIFFLEDENLAYDDFGKLFAAIREVLQENLGEHEILVVDIESLNIQLLEVRFFFFFFFFFWWKKCI